MDLSLMTAMMPPASAELPDARGTLKGDDASLLPFELALLSELQLLTPACDLPLEAGAEGGEGADLLDTLTASDPSKGGLPELPVSLITPAELVAQPSTPSTPQLILPPLAMQPTPLPAEQLGVATSPSSTPATVASATATNASLVPMAMAQLRAAEPAATVPAERGSEKPFARLTSSAPHASATPTAIPGEEVLDAPRAVSAAPSETLAHAQPEPPAARPRVSAWSDEPSADKLPVRGESAPQTHALARPAEIERQAVRVEPIAAEAVRTEQPAAPAPTASSSPAPASAFTAPTSQYTAPQPPAAVTAHIQTPFGHTEWAEQLREKVVWLVDRQQQTAELHIHPPHLGPVEVMLTLNDDRTSVAFVSPHPAVREAIEASFPDLRATLEERGLALGHASVSADSKDAREQLPQDAQPGRRLPGSLLTAEESHIQRRVVLQRGLVDTFA